MNSLGFSIKGNEHTFTIANGADGSAVTAVSLERPYKAIAIYCEDAQYIAATTSLSAKVSPNTSGALVNLYEVDDPGTQWSKGDLPTSGGFYTVITHAFGVLRIQPILSNNASGGAVVLTIIGLDGFN